jgi:hypothetical protein
MLGAGHIVTINRLQPTQMVPSAVFHFKGKLLSLLANIRLG